MNSEDRKFRPDIEGLRAVAVLLVMLSHAGLIFSGGYVGVDVFFVISGFLITRLLLDELSRSGTISLVEFYARRVRRILPLATLVIVVTLGAARIWMSPLQMHSIGMDALTATLSVVNYRLAITGTDYFAVSHTASPFQHYWSLSIEEQFYLIWPGLILLCVAVGARARSRQVLAVALSIVTIAGLALSYWITIDSQMWAYFGLHTRAWELAVGGLLALGLGWYSQITRWVRISASWVGLIAIVVSAYILTEQSVFPGLLALAPVLGAALVIVSNSTYTKGSSEWLLGQKAFQFLGKISYSLYLWHWPLIVIIPTALGRRLSMIEIVSTLIACVVISVLSYYFVERPLHKSKYLASSRTATYGLGVVLLGIATAVSMLVIRFYAPANSITRSVTTSAELTQIQNQVKLATQHSPSERELVVSIKDVILDKPSRDCIDNENADIPKNYKRCTFAPKNVSNPKTIVLFGDSHAHQWVDVVKYIAQHNEYKLVVYLKSGCPPVGDSITKPKTKNPYTECYKWRNEAIRQIGTLSPEYVIVTSLDRYTPSGELGELIAQFRKDAIEVIYLADTPYPYNPVPECLVTNKLAMSHCNLDKNTRLSPHRKNLITSAEKAGANIIDTESWFCSNNICPVVIDNIIVYHDGSHISATYAQYVSGVLEEYLVKIIGREHEPIHGE